MRVRHAAAALVLVIAAGRAAAQTEKLTPENFTKYRDLIEVKKGERGWDQIAWKSTFFEALVEAQKQDRPIFFWIYEGDPRKGC
jgi:hypothetical protein